MNEHAEIGRGTQLLLSAAAFVILVAGMKAAASILVPFIVAVFLAVISGPLVFWLKSKRVPSGLAVAVVVLLMVGVLTLAGMFVGRSLNRFLLALPSYEARLQQELTSFVRWLGERGFEVSTATLLQYLDPGAALGLAAGVLTSLGGLVTNAFLILLTVVFMLLEASSFPAKVREALDNPEPTLDGFSEFAVKLKRYIVIKTTICLATGIAVASWTSICGIDFPILWGVLAFLLNYIPSLGSILAAIPAVITAFIQSGLGGAIIVAVGYLGINIILGNLLEPRFLGQGLGLSTLVVFLSLVTWAWVLGPVGMFLSVPLTITVKIALESNERTRWIAVLLGPELREHQDPEDTASEERYRSGDLDGGA
jgi:AI-2 transport protein TqsA